MARWTSIAKQKLKPVEIIIKPIDDIEPDPTNPNIMTEEKFKALKRGIKKKKQLPYAIIIDQNNIIIDGFHRWKACKELGWPDVPCIVEQCKDEVDRKIWRQIYNKVRGDHDPVKDRADFLAIFEANRHNEFVELLGTQSEAFLKAIGQSPHDGSEIQTDADPTKGYLQSYLGGNVKQITLLMKNEEFESIFPKFKQACADFGLVDNHTEAFFKLVEFYENHKGCQKET